MDNLNQGTAIRDRIQERLMGQQSTGLLKNGKTDNDESEEYFDHDDDDFYYDEDDYYYDEDDKDDEKKSTKAEDQCKEETKNEKK